MISADGKTAWEFWHCTHAATPQEPWYTAAVAAKWSLDPDDPSDNSLGYQNEGLTATGQHVRARVGHAARAHDSRRRCEAVRGIHHPLGLTVVGVSDGYVNPPASHTDGCAGCGPLRYGMLFVLRSNFKPAHPPNIGELSIIEALKRYGAYIVDQGPIFELDGSPNEPTDPRPRTRSGARPASTCVDRDPPERPPIRSHAGFAAGLLIRARRLTRVSSERRLPAGRPARCRLSPRGPCRWSRGRARA